MQNDLNKCRPPTAISRDDSKICQDHIIWIFEYISGDYAYAEMIKMENIGQYSKCLKYYKGCPLCEGQQIRDK